MLYWNDNIVQSLQSVNWVLLYNYVTFQCARFAPLILVELVFQLINRSLIAVPVQKTRNIEEEKEEEDT